MITVGKSCFGMKGRLPGVVGAYKGLTENLHEAPSTANDIIFLVKDFLAVMLTRVRFSELVHRNTTGNKLDKKKKFLFVSLLPEHLQFSP